MAEFVDTSPDNLYWNLLSASIGVFLGVFFVLLIKIYGNIRVGYVGPELNIFTYGFLCDAGINAIRGGTYWNHVPDDIKAGKGLILLSIFILNFILMAWNFRLEDQINSANPWNPSPRFSKFGTAFLGVFSLFIYLFIKAFWD